MPTLVSSESVLASRWCPGAGPRHGCLNYESSESAARPCIGVQREEGIQQNEASNRRKSNFVEELAQFHI
jgi:hypothetical protein